MARLVDLERRALLLDRVVAHLAQHGLANVSLRPMAAALGVSVNSLVHHFGPKDDLIVAALRRSGAVQQEVERRWLERQPRMSQADLLRSWWRWITASPQNLAVVRLGIEAAALEATLSGLPNGYGVSRSDSGDRTSSSVWPARACRATSRSPKRRW